MTVVLVDWLGRGGIAQCTEAWALTLRDANIDHVVVTRPGRELGSGSITAEAPQTRQNRLLAHRDVARHAAGIICRDRPTTVVIQNYVVPILERPVYQAARMVGARLIVAVHDHRLHSRWAGSSLGLTRLLRAADTVLAYSSYVGEAVNAATHRFVEIIPLPVPLGMVRGPQGVVPFARREDRLLGLHFGTLHRSYKGSETIVELARSLPESWEVAMLGAGAPLVDGLVGIDRFVDAADLVAAVRAAAATLLPYHWATQSAAVVLAQVLGSVPVATSVGGIPEQIEDRRTGRLLPVGAPTRAWNAVLDELSDPAVREAMGTAAKAKVWADHEIFARAVARLTEGGL